MFLYCRDTGSDSLTQLYLFGLSQHLQRQILGNMDPYRQGPETSSQSTTRKQKYKHILF